MLKNKSLNLKQQNRKAYETYVFCKRGFNSKLDPHLNFSLPLPSRIVNGKIQFKCAYSVSVKCHYNWEYKKETNTCLH